MNRLTAQLLLTAFLVLDTMAVSLPNSTLSGSAMPDSQIRPGKALRDRGERLCFDPRAFQHPKQTTPQRRLQRRMKTTLEDSTSSSLDDSLNSSKTSLASDLDAESFKYSQESMDQYGEEEDAKADEVLSEDEDRFPPGAKVHRVTSGSASVAIVTTADGNQYVDKMAYSAEDADMLEYEFAIHQEAYKYCPKYVAKPLEYIDGPGKPRMLIEFLNGGDLFDLFLNPQDRNYNDMDMLALLKHMAQAVGCLHDHGIVHLDIKPHNFVLDLDPDVSLEQPISAKQLLELFGRGKASIKLIDFGYAAHMEEEGTAPTCGSPDYVDLDLITTKGGIPFSDAAKSDVVGLALSYLYLVRPNPYEDEAAEDVPTLRFQNGDMPSRYAKQFNGKGFSRDVLMLLKNMLERQRASRYTVKQVLESQLLKSIPTTDAN